MNKMKGPFVKSLEDPHWDFVNRVEKIQETTDIPQLRRFREELIALGYKNIAQGYKNFGHRVPRKYEGSYVAKQIKQGEFYCKNE